MAPNEVFTNTSKSIPTQMFQCFVYLSLTISVFLIRQKLDKHTDSPRSRYQNLGWFHFWNIKIFEGCGVLKLTYTLKMNSLIQHLCREYNRYWMFGSVSQHRRCLLGSAKVQGFPYIKRQECGADLCHVQERCKEFIFLLSSKEAARPHLECSNKPWPFLLSCRKKTALIIVFLTDGEIWTFAQVVLKLITVNNRFRWSRTRILVL